MNFEKTPYPTKKSAEKIMKKLWQIPDRKRKPIRAYLCEFCGKWHLTSKPFKVKNYDK